MRDWPVVLFASSVALSSLRCCFLPILQKSYLAAHASSSPALLLLFSHSTPLCSLALLLLPYTSICLITPCCPSPHHAVLSHYFLRPISTNCPTSLSSFLYHPLLFCPTAVSASAQPPRRHLPSTSTHRRPRRCHSRHSHSPKPIHAWVGLRVKMMMMQWEAIHHGQRHCCGGSSVAGEPGVLEVEEVRVCGQVVYDATTACVVRMVWWWRGTVEMGGRGVGRGGGVGVGGDAEEEVD